MIEELKAQMKQYEAGLEQSEKKLKNISAQSGVDDLKRQVAIYKLALSCSSMAKSARDVIEIRKELGDSPEIASVEESMVEVSENKCFKKSEIIRRTIYVALATANLLFLSKYTEVKNQSAISFYYLITFWASICALCNSIFVEEKRADRRAKAKYKQALDDLRKLMEEKEISPENYSLTKRIENK